MSKVSVQELVQNYSIETTVREAGRVEKFSDLVPAGTRIYIAHIPGTNLQDTVELATRLRKEGLEPVPHVVARRIETLAALDDFLSRLTGQAEVRQALIVAGDIPTPVGEISSALQILESGLLEKNGISRIGVAGHPEGHREVTEPVLLDALRRKDAYATKTGAQVYVVTQFTFSAEPIVAWERKSSAAMGHLPYIVGLPGLATARSLLKYAADCGVGASLEAFSKRAVSLTRLLTVSTPDNIIADLAAHKETNPQSHLSGVHFFPFGGFKKTAEWANKVAAGEFDLNSDGKGFEIR